MTPIEVLKQARQLLATKGWTIGAQARNCHGAKLTYSNLEAVSFDIVSALRRVAGGADDITDAARMMLKDQIGGRDKSLVRWNDALGRTKEEVLALFDKTIAEAER